MNLLVRHWKVVFIYNFRTSLETKPKEKKKVSDVKAIGRLLKVGKVGVACEANHYSCLISTTKKHATPRR